MPLIGQITSLAASIPVHFTVHSITCVSNYSSVLMFSIVCRYYACVRVCVCVLRPLSVCVQLLNGDHILRCFLPDCHLS